MIVLALSGGIDSAVAARLLMEQGLQVRGLFMKHRYQRENEDGAASVADFLGIPLEIVDVSEPFEEIVEHFTEEYFSGKTPNPCVRCNRRIKFGFLFDHAVHGMGGTDFATGHYVRLGEADDGAALFQARDETKDQSYVLHGIDRSILPRLRFPLGGYTKREVRRFAEEIGLPIAEKQDSQDICFVERGKHSEFLRRRRPETETAGRFISSDGRVLGLHGGFERFTVGQRKGMGVGFGRRIFVLKLDANTNDVVIGSWNELACTSLIARDVRWLLAEPPDEPFHCGVKIRYRCKTVSARVIPASDGSVVVELEEPQYGVAPGQSAVFYSGDRLLGGGTIVRDESPVLM